MPSVFPGSTTLICISLWSWTKCSLILLYFNIFFFIIQPVGPAAYTYQWEVSDPEGNNFYGHGERRDGDFTSGSYFVLLPDGRRQRVDYTVSAATGYVATVTYD